MNPNKILGRLKLKGKNVEWLVNEVKSKGVKISYSTIYKKLRGKTPFNAPEIIGISKALNLSNDEIMDIFFNELVS